MEMKEYLTPEMEVIKIKTMSSLLTISTGEPTIHDEDPDDTFKPV